jgi:integrase
MVINLVCRYAVEESGDLDSNPARDVHVPKDLEKTPRQIASDEDIARVKASTDCTFGMFAYWLMYTGMRRGELLALTWEDVDVKARSISVTKSVYHVNNKPQVKQPKTASGYRTLPLLNKLMAKITPGKGLVFPDPATGGLMSNMHFQNLWSKYAEESGVTCTSHQLRHAYATMLEENNISEKDAQYLLGHAQISTTKDIYTHIRESKKEKINAQLLDVDL